MLNYIIESNNALENSITLLNEVCSIHENIFFPRGHELANLFTELEDYVEEQKDSWAMLGS